MKKHIPFIIFFIAFLIIGFCIYGDYGISWDEPACRTDTGILTYNYVHTGDYDALIKNNAKYHGSAFEYLLIYMEKFFALNNIHQIFMMRHFTNFIVFAISIIFFYLLILKNLKSTWLALAGSMFLVLSPRIFADSFYNSKDLVFTSFLVINLYTTMHFLRKRTFLSALVNAFVSALVIDTRLMGVIIPPFTLLFLLIDFIKEKSQRRNIAIIGFSYIIFLVVFIISLWPVLWRSPLFHFIEGIRELGMYPWPGKVFFNGVQIPATLIPWYYVPEWLVITTPLLYSILFLAGIVFTIKKLFIDKKLPIAVWLNAYVFFIPPLMVIVLGSVVYDGWRHLYFIYPSFIFLALIGVSEIFKFFSSKKSSLVLLKCGILTYCLFIAIQMYALHPNEYIYFNFLAGKSFEQARTKFEGDYWILSYRDGLEKIAMQDTTRQFSVYAHEPDLLEYNAGMLPHYLRARISIAEDPEMGDYFITTFRNHPNDYNMKPACHVIRDKGIVCTVYDCNANDSGVFDKRFLVSEFKNDFESQKEGWRANEIVTSSNSFSGEKMVNVEASSQFDCELSVNPPAGIISGDLGNIIYAEISFMIFYKQSVEARAILELDSSAGGNYLWASRDIHTIAPNSWVKYRACFRLLKIHSAQDRLRVYIWNPDSKNFNIDDMEVKLYSVPNLDRKMIIDNRFR